MFTYVQYFPPKLNTSIENSYSMFSRENLNTVNHNPRVGGSSPSSATNKIKGLGPILTVLIL